MRGMVEGALGWRWLTFYVVSGESPLHRFAVPLPVPGRI